MRDFLDVAIEAGHAGGAILLEEYARPAQISYKGEVDLVTQADRRSEAEILGILRREFPEHAIVAEESGASGGALVGETAPRWMLSVYTQSCITASENWYTESASSGNCRADAQPL